MVRDLVMLMMMSLYTTDCIFNLKNILRQLDVVVEWKSLGIELDISSARLNEIEVNNRGMVGACRRAMVEVWRATDLGASWSKLAGALVAVGQDVRAEHVRGLGRQAGELYLSGCGFVYAFGFFSAANPVTTPLPPSRGELL